MRIKLFEEYNPNVTFKVPNTVDNIKYNISVLELEVYIDSKQRKIGEDRRIITDDDYNINNDLTVDVF